MNWKMMVLTLALGVSVAIPASAEEQNTTGTKKENQKPQWMVGGGIGYSSSPYKDYDNKITALPVVNFENKRFYVRGLEAGVKVVEKGPHSVRVGLAWHTQSFSAEDSDDRQLQLLDDRDATLMANVSYQHKSKYGIAQAKVSADVLGNSEGVIVDASYRYPVVNTKKFKALAGGGVEWANGSQNDYYYGISDTESRRSGLKAYEAESGLTPYLAVEARYDISKRWSAFAVGRVNFLNDEVTDSPMVDRSTTYHIGAGVLYKF